MRPPTSSPSIPTAPPGAARGDRRAFGLDPARIVCGNGSDELLNLDRAGVSHAGRRGDLHEARLPRLRNATLAAGGKPVVVPESDYTADVDAILAALTPRTRIVFIANPNNPTGTYVPFSTMRRLHAALPATRCSCSTRPMPSTCGATTMSRASSSSPRSDNVVMTRTFSKIHGLAGAAHRMDVRAGARDRRRQPHPRAVQREWAGDRGRRRRAWRHGAHRARGRAQCEVAARGSRSEIRELGLEVTPSVGELRADPFPERAREDGEGRGRVSSSSAALVLRRLEAYHLPDALRMTVGTEEANRLVVSALSRLSRT